MAKMKAVRSVPLCRYTVCADVIVTETRRAGLLGPFDVERGRVLIAFPPHVLPRLFRHCHYSQPSTCVPSHSRSSSPYLCLSLAHPALGNAASPGSWSAGEGLQRCAGVGPQLLPPPPTTPALARFHYPGMSPW